MTFLAILAHDHQVQKLKARRDELGNKIRHNSKINEIARNSVERSAGSIAEYRRKGDLARAHLQEQSVKSLRDGLQINSQMMELDGQEIRKIETQIAEHVRQMRELTAKLPVMEQEYVNDFVDSLKPDDVSARVGQVLQDLLQSLLGRRSAPAEGNGEPQHAHGSVIEALLDGFRRAAEASDDGDDDDDEVEDVTNIVASAGQPVTESPQPSRRSTVSGRTHGKSSIEEVDKTASA